MIELVWGPRFRKAYNKLVKHNPDKKEKLFNALRLFAKDPFHPNLKTHKLGGPLKNFYSFSLGYDCRVLFKFTSKTEAYLITIGTHEEVY